MEIMLIYLLSDTHNGDHWGSEDYGMSKTK